MPYIALRKCKVQASGVVRHQIIPMIHSIVCYCTELQASGGFSSVVLPISSQSLLSVSLFVSLVAS